MHSRILFLALILFSALPLRAADTIPPAIQGVSPAANSTIGDLTQNGVSPAFPHIFRKGISATLAPRRDGHELALTAVSGTTRSSCLIFRSKGRAASEIQAIVAAWQAGAISRDTMTDLFRRGEVLPEGRTNEEELKLLAASQVVSVVPA